MRAVAILFVALSFGVACEDRGGMRDLDAPSDRQLEERPEGPGEAVEETARDVGGELQELGENVGESIDATGVVTDMKDNKVGLRLPNGEEMSLDLPDDVSVNGELREGAEVRASYREEQGRRQVERIDVLGE